MARICPACGSQAIDDQSLFCNKCGTPFPSDQPKKVLVRTTPRLAETPPPAPPSPEPVPVTGPPAPEYRAPAAPPARISSEPPRARVPAPRPGSRQQAGRSPLPFTRCLVRDFLRPVYWLGVLAILLIVLGGVMADAATTAPAGESSGSGKEGGPLDLLSAIPVFWIGVFIAGNLVWRVLCESGAALFALYDAGTTPDNPRGLEMESLPDDRVIDDGMAGGQGGMVQCPRCGRTVPAEEMRTCEHCGTVGCSACVRLMGLIKKTLTCRDCFQSK